MLRSSFRNLLLFSAFLVVCLQAPSASQVPPAVSAQSQETEQEQEEESFEMPTAAPSFNHGPLASRYGSRDQSKSYARIMGDPLTSAGMGAASGGVTAAQLAEQPAYYVYEFGAKWCPSCRDLAPMVMAIASKYQGFVQVIPVDIDTPSAKPLVQKLGLRAVPTVIISDRQGNQLQTLVGLQQGMKLDKILNDYRRRASSGPGPQ